MLSLLFVVLLLAFSIECTSLPTERAVESRTCTFEDPTLPSSPPGLVPHSLCDLDFGSGVVVESSPVLQFFKLDGNQGAAYLGQTTGSFTSIYPGGRYKSIKPESFQFLCTVKGPTAAFPEFLQAASSFILEPIPPAAVANLPQSCVMTVTATFLDGTAQQQICSFAPQPELLGIYIPQPEDLTSPTQRLATCILPSTWQNVMNVGLSSAPEIDLPAGSTLSSSILVDTIVFSGNI